MSARRLSLPAIVAAILAVAGCTYPEAPKGDDPPQAPPPREKGAKQDDSRAALLVGKWKMVSEVDENGKPLPLDPGYECTVEYTADGTVTIWINNPVAQPHRMRPNPRTISRTYRMEGGKLIHTSGPPGKTREHVFIIDSLTRDKLITTLLVPDGNPSERVIGEYERIQKKL